VNKYLKFKKYVLVVKKSVRENTVEPACDTLEIFDSALRDVVSDGSERKQLEMTGQETTCCC
jgi:hypothetical protein